MAKENDMDEILAYMFLMLREADYKGLSIRKEEFVEHGKGMKFFPGVETWFERMNDYAAQRNVNLKHYIVSSGLREMIQGTSIASQFSAIFASGFMYNQDGVAIWPALAVNYTTKTQFIFRINKGVENSWDIESVNEYVALEDRPIPQQNIVYLGDGETDVPAMKMVKYLGGNALAVYDEDRPAAKDICDDLLVQDRADYSIAANYEDGSQLDKTMKKIIDNISA